MRYKINFQQTVEGIENCECVVEADDEVEALTKFYKRDFTIYLVTKQEAERHLIMDTKPELRPVEGT